jgi:hypothetical protein
MIEAVIQACVDQYLMPSIVFAGLVLGWVFWKAPVSFRHWTFDLLSVLALLIVTIGFFARSGVLRPEVFPNTVLEYVVMAVVNFLWMTLFFRLARLSRRQINGSTVSGVTQ